MYLKNTNIINNEFKIYIDDLYEVLYKCKLNNDLINITLKKNTPDYLAETHNCYNKFVVYINKNNIKKLYNFIKLHFSIELFDNLINIIDINKFLNDKSYGLIAYICDSNEILKNTKGGFIIIYNNNFNINIIKNDKELFSTLNYVL
jgi:hypothetical protein